MRKMLALLVGTLAVLGAAAPADATVFEIYIRGHGGYEYLDLSAIDYSGALNPANYGDLSGSQQDFINKLTKQYKGNGYVVGGAAGVELFDFLDLGIDFRQAGLSFDSGRSGDLTQLTLNVAWHILGSSLIVDPSLALGLGYCYLTTTIPVYAATFDPLNPGAPASTEERTFNGWIGRVGAAVDFRFISWMSVGVAADVSFLYFDGGAEKKSWGFNLDVLGRISFHI
jgi:opacity protein-like surface antigen